jgi:hypothetical protein
MHTFGNVRSKYANQPNIKYHMASNKKIRKAKITVVARASEGNATQLAAMATCPLSCNWCAAQLCEKYAVEKAPLK